MEVPSEEPAPKRPKPDDQWRLERTQTTPATADDEAQHAFDAVKGKERHRLGPAVRLLQDGTAAWHPRSLREWLRTNTKLRPTDVVVACYPKCGTTLTEQIVLLALNGGDAASLDPLSKNAKNYLKDEAAIGKVWPEACLRPDTDQTGGDKGKEEFVPMTRSAFDALPAPRVIKTHARVRNLLGNEGGGLVEGAKYVICTRNPFDACVSAYYHAWHPKNSGWPFDAWAEAWLESDQWSPNSSWFRWHTEWRDTHASNQSQCLWLWYEDLVSNPDYWARKVAHFVTGVEPDDELVSKLVQGASFEKMKQHASRSENASRLNSSDHLRVGKTGTWRDHFAPYPGLEEKFREVLRKRMAGPGLAWNVGEGDALATPIVLPA